MIIKTHHKLTLNITQIIDRHIQIHSQIMFWDIFKGQGFPAHKVAAVAAYRDRCQTKKETHARSCAYTKRKLLSTLNVNGLSQVHDNKSLYHQNPFNASLSSSTFVLIRNSSQKTTTTCLGADPTDHVSTVPSPQPTWRPLEKILSFNLPKKKKP